MLTPNAFVSRAVPKKRRATYRARRCSAMYTALTRTSSARYWRTIGVAAAALLEEEEEEVAGVRGERTEETRGVPL